MAFVVPQVGGRSLLDFMMSSYINTTATCSAGLYVSPTTAMANTQSVIVAAQSIFSPTSGIYGAVSSAAGTAYAPAPAFTFTQTGTVSQVVYGWYMQNNSGQVVLAEHFTAGPITLEANGDQVRISSHTFRMHSP